jgi:hypothetical protein
MILFFATCFGHLWPSSGIYEQWNSSTCTFITGMHVSMDPLLLVYKFCIGLQYLNIMKYLPKLIKLILKLFYKNYPFIYRGLLMGGMM